MSMHEDTDKFMTATDRNAAGLAIVLVVMVPLIASLLAGLL